MIRIPLVLFNNLGLFRNGSKYGPKSSFAPPRFTVIVPFAQTITDRFGNKGEKWKPIFMKGMFTGMHLAPDGKSKIMTQQLYKQVQQGYSIAYSGHNAMTETKVDCRFIPVLSLKYTWLSILSILKSKS